MFDTIKNNLVRITSITPTLARIELNPFTFQTPSGRRSANTVEISIDFMEYNNLRNGRVLASVIEKIIQVAVDKTIVFDTNYNSFENFEKYQIAKAIQKIVDAPEIKPSRQDFVNLNHAVNSILNLINAWNLTDYEKEEVITQVINKM